MKLFFEANDKGHGSPILLWKTFKAFVRGCVFSCQSSQKKRLQLKEQIRELDAENAAHPSTQALNKATAVKYQLNQLFFEKNSRAFTLTRQTYFEFGDKPHKLLARQKRESDRTIYKSHKDINHTFRHHY